MPRRGVFARFRDGGELGWPIAAILISIIALGPVIAIFVIALQSSGDTWPHLIANVLPGAVRRTLGLMAGVGALTLAIGTGTAWLVTMYRFPGRRAFEWLLLLPLAVPTYIIAFSYLELFDYSGIVQTTLRQLFGWRDAQDYWFPDIRSLGGAIFVMSMVLYPYVYITARASFLAQSVCVLEVSSHSRPKRDRDFLGGGAAARAAGARRRLGAGVDGDVERHWRGRVFWRADAHGRRL